MYFHAFIVFGTYFYSQIYSLPKLINYFKMSTLRFHAIKESLASITCYRRRKRTSIRFVWKNVFNENTMRQYLTKDAFIGVMNAIQYGKKIDRSIADQVASSMKDWSLSKGVTHYTHWFQPLTGATAEKHDAFFETIGRRYGY